MIHLCYLKKKIPSQDEFYEQFLTAIFSQVAGTDDLIITNEPVKKREGFHILNQHEIDLEIIPSIPCNNIFLLEFDEILSKITRSLINIKSKSSEIIGISNRYNDMYKNIQLEVQSFREEGCSDDEVAVALILKNNRSSRFINHCLERDRSAFKKNANVKELDDIFEITKLIKK